MILIIWSVYWWVYNLNIALFPLVIYDLSETENNNAVRYLCDFVQAAIKENKFVPFDNIELNTSFADVGTWLKT